MKRIYRLWRNLSRAARTTVIGAATLALMAACGVAGDRGGDWLSEEELIERFPLSTRPARAEWASPGVCQECHEDSHADWMASHHALANRPLDPAIDGPVFDGEMARTLADEAYRAVMADGLPTIVAAEEGTAPGPVIGALGEIPLRQYIVEVRGGRYQAHSLAWDPDRWEWFDVFGGERRFEGEWGHWTGQGMNWNANCAWCHMTEFEKNYDINANTYDSQWTLQTVSCIQCHAGMEEHVREARANPNYTRSVPGSAPALTAEQTMHNCASCHSRREELTRNRFRAGEDYHDHFRLTLPDQPGAYFADIQALEENYVFGSFMLSRMGQSGVTCADCHDPHTGVNILPAENNSLCMRCHSTGLDEAPVIDALAHSHHPAGSTGNRCIECHMPERVYMARDPRRDHHFTSPDPALSRRYGQPNACNQCHEDQSVEWAGQWVDQWYGTSERRQTVHRRAELLARAHAGEASAAPELAGQYEQETNAYWQAVWMRLLRSYADRPEIRSLAATALREHAHPLVRDAAVEIVAFGPEGRPLIESVLEDPSRMVRIQAAGQLLPEFDPAVEAYREWQEYAEMNADRPGGSLRLADFRLQQGSPEAARAYALRAVEFDRFTPELKYDASILLARAGFPQEALVMVRRGLEQSPKHALLAYSEGLLLAEMGDLPGAVAAMGRALAIAPGQARWWYNYAIGLARLGRSGEALSALQEALQLEPENPRFLRFRDQLVEPRPPAMTPER